MSNAFAFGDFISFDERQKKQKQRKTLCAKGKPGCLLMKGFFERASCPREKRRTSMCGALRVCRLAGWRWNLQKRKAKTTATATEIGRAHSELQSLMRISYAVFCLKKKNN